MQKMRFMAIKSTFKIFVRNNSHYSTKYFKGPCIKYNNSLCEYFCFIMGYPLRHTCTTYFS